MKKRLIFITILSLGTLSASLVSCDKDDDSKSCTCTETDYSGYSATQTLDPASFGATNCSDLAIKLRMQADDDFDYSCN